MTTTHVPTELGSTLFANAREVSEEVRLEVTGTLPQELRGTLYRNGPGRFEAGGFRAAHPFDGDGLVSKFVIDNGEVRFRSRYVRTPKFLAEERGRGATVRGLYSDAKGLRHNVGRYPADVANTHAVAHGGRLLALSDVGRPWEIDRDDLRTIGPCTFDGRLPRLTRFSPHPKIDPITGELFNFGLDIDPRLGAKIPAALHCYRVDRTGKLSTVGKVSLDNVIVQHDFAITEHYLVFALAPIIVDPVRAALALAGFGTTGDAAEFRSEVGMKIVLLPRDGGKPRVLEWDPLVYVHVDNAFEDGDDVVLDVVRHPSFDLLAKKLKLFRTEFSLRIGDDSSAPVRLRISRTGRVRREDLDLPDIEFPIHDERRTGREHRYTYFAASAADCDDNAVVKLDRRTGRVQRHPMPNRELPGEPIFVPRSNTAAEDDGWLLSVTYLPAEHRTALMILDAADIERAPIAVARSEGAMFPGFHGSFTDRVAVSS
jgi:all-trans-8'-apo-beta-carotenal 15,15'-oxygenase